jgi:calcineurin-like phosphoesterase family protein
VVRVVWLSGERYFAMRLLLGSKTQAVDEALIAKWNNRVRPADDVYHLGDFAMNNPSECDNILGRLNGNIHLLRGESRKGGRSLR